MSYQSPRRWMRLTLVALFALTLLGTFPVATRAASTPAATADTAASPQLPAAPAHAARAQPNTLSWIGEPTSELRQLCQDVKGRFGDTIIPAGSWVEVIVKAGVWCYVYWPAGRLSAWVLGDALCP
jgi:hypothetical protein